MYHEGQLHQRSWICGNQCYRKFPTPQLLKIHMLDCHLGTFAESQLPILIDMCERPADPDERASCPLCGVEATLRALRAHVASHLEDVALFILPVETNDHDTDANSHHAERPREKDNRLDDDLLSSLGRFGEDEDDQAPLQDPKAFETALKKEGQYSLPEVGDWLGIGQEVRSEEEEREDAVQADLDADVEANGRRKTERLVLFEQSRIADVGENQYGCHYDKDIFQRETARRRALDWIRLNERHEEEEVHDFSIIDFRDKGRRFDAEESEKDGLWTEITKDLVTEEAIREVGYEFEETEEFYYITEYLRYVRIRLYPYLLS